MRSLRRIFDFYIGSSIHVALSVLALVYMTYFMFRLPHDNAVSLFAFCGTIVGYNFVKYDALARRKNLRVSNHLKAIIALSILAFLVTAFCFFRLRRITQLTGIFFLALTMLYTLPFFPNRKNARNWAGVKIYMVALCWAGITLFLPVINAGIPIDFTIVMIALQRFILIFVLILVFEIIDLQVDDPNLKTVPQQIGVRKTKIAGGILLLIFVIAPFFIADFPDGSGYVRTGIALTVMFFLLFANEKRSKYYTSFWAESIPIFWWVLLLLLR